MTSSQPVQISTEYASIIANNYCAIAGIVLFLYDAVITTGNEIHCFWGRKVTGAAVLFWLNKYIVVVFSIKEAFSGFVTSENGCTIGARLELSLQLCILLISAAFTSLRIYALRKNWVLSLAIALLMLVPVGVNLTQFFYGLGGAIIPMLGCESVVNVPNNLGRSFTIVSRTSLAAADCIALAATWLTLLPQYNIRHAGVEKASFSRVLLVDGTIYFLILAILNTLHLTFTILSLDISSLEDTSNIAQFTTPFTAILISRFLLHLQSANLKATGVTSSLDLLSQGNSLVFDRVVGSLRMPLSPDDYFQNGDDDIEDIQGEL